MSVVNDFDNDKVGIGKLGFRPVSVEVADWMKEDTNDEKTFVPRQSTGFSTI